jgi:type I restriction enzyme S subunit
MGLCVPSKVKVQCSSLTLLREFQNRLIADVVTGKVDVREAAARLPDQPQKAEQIDYSEAETDVEEVPEDASETSEEIEA